MKYATLKQNTWTYRRHYPSDVKVILGTAALKQSLKTGDVKVAQERVAEINVRFDETVRRIRAGLDAPTEHPSWSKEMTATVRAIDWSPVSFSDFRKSPPVGALCEDYLRLKEAQLEPSSFKAVRYSVELFVSPHRWGPLIGRTARRSCGTSQICRRHWASPIAITVGPRTRCCRPRSGGMT